jgi:transcription elongation GreA/GreB family factor
MKPPNPEDYEWVLDYGPHDSSVEYEEALEKWTEWAEARIRELEERLVNAKLS